MSNPNRNTHLFAPFPILVSPLRSSASVFAAIAPLRVRVLLGGGEMAAKKASLFGRRRRNGLPTVFTIATKCAGGMT